MAQQPQELASQESVALPVLGVDFWDPTRINEHGIEQVGSDQICRHCEYTLRHDIDVHVETKRHNNYKHAMLEALPKLATDEWRLRYEGIRISEFKALCRPCG